MTGTLSQARLIIAPHSIESELVVKTSAKQLKLRRLERKQNRAFLLVLVAVVAIVFGISLSIGGSTRPNFYYTTPPPASPPIVVVDWPTLEAISTKTGGPTAARPDLFRSIVQISGYLLEHNHRLLLTPDLGNWFHPPHLDAGETIEVQLPPDARVANRTAVTVRGKLSVNSGGAYSLQTESIEPIP